MKKIFYLGIAGLAILEILKVYFIMPMPGSQTMESLDAAYFIHTYRWYFRVLFCLMVVTGSLRAFQIEWKWVPVLALLLVGIVVYYFNFKMTAESIFKEPQVLSFKTQGENLLSDSSIVIAVVQNGDAKAYPIRYIGYHHQVRDTIGGEPVMITYCTVCRTGRAFEPVVNGKIETFRLVGMDHFNAMFEDASTKSWWRQVTGEAVAGPLKGSVLPEVESMQVTLNKFFSMYPFGKVMQADAASMESYDSLARYEKGKSKSMLTRTDSLSWKDKSWVIGVEAGNFSKAYDWNELKTKSIIQDRIGDVPVIVALSDDGQSFAAFEIPSESIAFTIKNDTLFADHIVYDFAGRNIKGSTSPLRRIKAYQEFWHSWRMFHPNTERYE
ncbi:MAG TPA: DUF3179 domain-containing (seleno)protein [Cyclobacteriaceae bacterium]|nr:DUF3179 domain-containing (seleno)protein [Cyclobacteriaceae bacterium]